MRASLEVRYVLRASCERLAGMAPKRNTESGRRQGRRTVLAGTKRAAGAALFSRARLLVQSGIDSAPFANVIVSPAAGLAAIGGTFAAVMAGAAPGVPPRGVVRTTCEGGRGVPFLRLA